MLNPKYSLNCCTCLIWFEFETWFEFELKTLEKINRKAIRNSLENGKAISAQVGPLSPARRARLHPRALGAWQTGPACRRQPSRPLSLSLSRCSVGPIYRRRSSRTRARSLCPEDPTRQSVPNLLPMSLAVDVPTTARSPATFSSSRPFRSRTQLAYFPSLTCALSRTLSPPLLPCARDQTSSAATHRRPPSVLRPPSSPLPVHCLGEFP
jgi:hypothetical protein